ncbi:MAG: NADH-quinone oxidoreductase subunit NuoF [Chloroflexi bacterium]|nr:MAG: NADH-quinone oxidoreductase subunit NuoF [Chloroflexota bacterium]
MMHDKFEQITEREEEKAGELSHTVKVCMAAGCLSSQSDALLEALQDNVGERGCKIKGVGCMGLCAEGPLVEIDTQKGDTVESVMYQHVTPDDAEELIASIDSDPVERLKLDKDVPFFKNQVKIALENSGQIDPERLEEYIAAGGYWGLLTAVTEMGPTEVIDEIVTSGLRGRGGGGYPTGLKWNTVAKMEGAIKYIICNADEGDPGAFMDRTVLESDPHRVLEGMALAGYAVGATEGYVYVRGEYPLAIERLKKAIRQAKRMGILGHNVCGTTFDFNVHIRIGAGAFVCGEETALIASIEGQRGTPRPRPPYPAEYGLWGHPTLINNVESFANVPAIIRNGGDWYADIGTENSKGTKVFALAGSIQNTGIIEVPMGITLNEIVFDMGGGIPNGRECKAVQTGGPSGGCIPLEYFDTPVDYDSLRELGSIMGSGGMIVMDETSSMVDVARYFMEFCMSESCGKCVPCRVGTVHMHNLLDKIYSGNGSSRDLALLEKLCEMVKETSLCGLGQTAPNPVISTLRYFRQEYLDLLSDGETVANVEVEAEVAV